ncbi:MAG TPA: hypothetical protein VGI40_01285 [Pirellulaceae bacterium]|jgi:hypothetical protein
MAASEHEQSPAGDPATNKASGRRQPPGKSVFGSERRLLAGLLVFTLLVRGTVLWFMRGNLEQDPDAYREIAENLIVHGEFALGKLTPQTADWHPRPTAYRPPLYPVVLSNLRAADRQHVSLVKVGVLHLVLGVATVWLTWLTARRVGCAHRFGNMVGAAHPTNATWPPVIASLIVACDPILLNQQALVMTETLAAFLAILSLWCLARFDAARTPFNAAMAGGAIGLAVLCRPTFLPWLGLIAVTMLFLHGGPAFKSQIPNLKFGNLPWRVANVAGLTIIAAAVMSPWAIRNYRVFGKPMVTTTHGGYTLLLGNNEFFYKWLRDREQDSPWDSALLDEDLYFQWALWWMVQPRDQETTYDAFCYRLARTAIRKEPSQFALACAYRINQLWSPLPHKLTADESIGRRWLRYATCMWYCGVYLLAAIGVWRLRWKLFASPWIWGVLLCIAFTAVHTFYWTNLRMRAPLIPLIALVAAAAIDKRKI